MSTDFTYNSSTISASGPFEPTSIDTPLDARTRVDTISEISKIPKPYIGMQIYVTSSEKNNNNPQIFVVTSLKANKFNIPNTIIDKYVTLEEFLNISELINSNAGKILDSFTYEDDILTAKSGDNILASVNIGNKLKILTQEEYDTLEVKEDSVAYIISDQDSYIKDILQVGKFLRLTTNDIQKAVVSGDITIIPPTVSNYTKIKLYLILSEAANVTLPTAKKTFTTTSFEVGKVYLLTFTTLEGSDWLIDAKVFA